MLRPQINGSGVDTITKSVALFRALGITAAAGMLTQVPGRVMSHIFRVGMH